MVWTQEFVADGFLHFPFNFHNLLVIQNSSSFWLNSKEEKHDFFGPVSWLQRVLLYNDWSSKCFYFVLLLLLLMFYPFFHRILLHLECIAFWTCAASMNYRLCTPCWIKDRGSSFILCMRTIPSITSLRGKFDEHRLRQIISFVVIVDNQSFLFEVTSNR